MRGAEVVVPATAAAATIAGLISSVRPDGLPCRPLKLRFDDDAQRTAFYTEVLARGILLHPRHLWFISGAHEDADIERTLEACDAGFAAAARICDRTRPKTSSSHEASKPVRMVVMP